MNFLILNPFIRAILIATGITMVLCSFFWQVEKLHNTPSGVGECVWHAAEEATKHDHADILLVKYQGLDIGHAYCIYEQNNNRFGWDWRGPQQVLACENAFDLAQELSPPMPNLVPVSAQLIHVK